MERPVSPVDANSGALPGQREQNYEGTLLARLSQRAQQAQQAQRAQRAQLAQQSESEQLPQLEQPPQYMESTETRAFWYKPWPWIGIGLAGFGVLAWGLYRGMRRMERN